MTEICKAQAPESPSKALAALRRGGVIIYPTETLYGLGAVAADAEAVLKLFEYKGRPRGKPIPILVRDEAMLAECAEVDERASALIRKFLPGALTLILKQRRPLPELISAGSGNLALRISAHPFVRRLFDVLDEPLTSTSANPSGGENLTRFAEILSAFHGRVELAVDSGNIPPSRGSTILDLTVNPPRVAREGDIAVEQLKEFL
ncbi:MAG: L-threonylcarbamoyladenylate synthase [Deltaproteobacteria bacterium]